MDDADRAAALGVAAALAVVGLLVSPYLLTDPRAIGVYYGGSVLGPPLAGLFALVAAIALAGGSTGRSDPPTAAGVAVVLGGLAALLLVAWAPGVSPSLVGGLTTLAAFEYHRWAVATAGLGLLIGAAWFALETV